MSDQRLLEIATAVGRIEGKLDEALKADRDRLGKLEKAHERQWYITYVVTPFLVVAHAIARKLGVQI